MPLSSPCENYERDYIIRIGLTRDLSPPLSKLIVASVSIEVCSPCAASKENFADHFLDVWVIVAD